MKKILSAAVITLLITPSITNAAFWNWFTQTKPATNTLDIKLATTSLSRQLEIKERVIEKKIADPSIVAENTKLKAQIEELKSQLVQCKTPIITNQTNTLTEACQFLKEKYNTSLNDVRTAKSSWINKRETYISSIVKTNSLTRPTIDKIDTDGKTDINYKISRLKTDRETFNSTCSKTPIEKSLDEASWDYDISYAISLEKKKLIDDLETVSKECNIKMEEARKLIEPSCKTHPVGIASNICLTQSSKLQTISEECSNEIKSIQTQIELISQ